VQLLQKDELEKIKNFDSRNDRVDRLILQQVTLKHARRNSHEADVFAHVNLNQNHSI